MNTLDKKYLNSLRNIISNGERKSNRTGIDTIAVAGTMIQHDMFEGFPILTTKKLSFKNIASELEFFIKGLNSKRWLQERGNHIWDNWANSRKVPYGTDDVTRKLMREEDDLGEIYGRQWRDFHDPNLDGYSGVMHVDQLKGIVDTLKNNPNDRRMICCAWNPLALDRMALVPCHTLWQVTVINGKLNLLWYQRSCDSFIGIPYNLASYGLLLHLLAKESNLKEGKLVGFFGDYHIYVNHLKQVKEQMTRTPFDLPRIQTSNFKSIFDWQYTDSELVNYQAHPSIKAEIAV